MRERADTIERVIELGRLSREAKAWLESKHRPTTPAHQSLTNGPSTGFYVTPSGAILSRGCSYNSGGQVHPIGHISKRQMHQWLNAQLTGR